MDDIIVANIDGLLREASFAKALIRTTFEMLCCLVNFQRSFAGQREITFIALEALFKFLWQMG